ncbi:winged helix-turn-helix domain-containing protein [Bradyrhizobium sp. NBAIM03]|uniref:winged helix-turn-helix domain-containing protein n=1 Tax=Bradyrhizobium sp. NBAIM03 TaxID=2793816 RepID=UPI001CD4184A|nr:winged helix-turn-helix domain-containing protein [Bradyrhizobium sp. NBAIM03]MCA1533488.1 winged helix-turn-helix domain-containing protein [Bradyrhizobium sp. NBAIM03]
MRYLFEDFALDADKRELRRGIDAVSVTPQAFDVLLYLIRNRQRVVSKDDLISAIWGGRAISDAALATRLNAARAAIHDAGDQQRLIKTLQRKGFRFIGSVQEIGGQDDAAVPNDALQPSTPAPAPSDKPAIAVLPFQSMPARPEQEYFADGLVDDIITTLSRFRTLSVIARNSSFTYKGKAVDIKRVGQELGVRYVLEGSVRKGGSQLRINAQLIDVATGAHLWADRFEGALGNVFDLQDQVALHVVGAIAPEVDRAEIDRASRKRTGNIDAVTAYYRGLPHIRFPTTPQNNEAASRHFEQAIALDPSFAPAYGGAATCIAWRRANNWPGDFVEDNAQVLQIAERLKELGADDAMALTVVGFLLFWFALDLNGGVELVERAIHFNPTYGPALHARGLIRGWQGESDAAVADLELALHLSPRDPFNYNAMLGLALAHHNAGRHAEAGEWADKAVRAFPPAFNVGMAQAILCYVGAGRLDDAQRLMAEILRRSSGSRRSTVAAPHYSPKLRAELLEAMIKAGLPE